ncbi:MAG TPA: Gfo/Idh/MocA family oxidoreductase [Gemmataceae bacterium]|nr:Gfo/Idh/MocA family oxidoreductase [Gemmataceae bacterium]
MKRSSRRRFLQSVAAAGSVLLLPSARVLGANDDIRVAVVGVRIRGSGLLRQFRQIPGVRVAALCDVDRQVLDEQVRYLTEHKETVITYADVRKLLDDKSIDAVAIATPNHWHALLTVWACQAGKDVYVEKPVSHNVWEGRQAVRAARKYRRIVQTGTQNRSDVGLRAAVEYLRAGHLGRVLGAHGIWFQRRESIGKVDGPQPIPEHIDYDLWCGPAPRRPLRRKELHYDWNWDWETGNGDMGNLGVHQLDDCRFLLGYDGWPRRVLSLGGRFGYVDDGQTPNTQLAVFEYEPVPILIEIRTLPVSLKQYLGVELDQTKLRRYVNVIRCEGGYLGVGRGGGWAYDRDGKKVRQFKGDEGAGHPANFIKAVRSRNPADLHADIEQGHLSSALCHLANISYRLGSGAPPREIEEALSGHAAAREAFQSIREHLAENGVDLKQTPCVLGQWLTPDPQTERIMGKEIAARADPLWKRAYRKPFVVPEEV